MIPNAKLIMILRNPIERAVSDYLYHFKSGLDTRTFETSIKEALEWISLPIEKRAMWRKGILAGDPNTSARYLHLGLYGLHLSKIKLYFPEEQLHVIDFAELSIDSVGTVNKVFRFLGVDEFVPYNVERQNVSDKSDFVLDSLTREKLKEYFYEDIVLLQTLVDFDVKKWLD